MKNFACILFCCLVINLYAQADSTSVSYTKDSIFIKSYVHDSLYQTLKIKKHQHRFYMNVGLSFINKEALYVQGYYRYLSLPKKWYYQLSLGGYALFNNGLHTVIPEIGGEMGWRGVSLGGYLTPQSVEPRLSARMKEMGSTSLYIGYAFAKDKNQEYLNGITTGVHMGLPLLYSIQFGYNYIGRNTFYSELNFPNNYLCPYLGLHLTSYQGDFKAIVEPGLKCFLTRDGRRYLAVGYTSYGILGKVGLLNTDYIDIYTGYAFSTDDRDIVKGVSGGICLRGEFFEIFLGLLSTGGRIF